MDVQISTLSNGMRVITAFNPNIETAAIGIWTLVGTRYEDQGINGISHFIEHMLFKGTKSRTAFDLAKEIEDVGGSLNAYTSYDRTCYYARVMKEHVNLGLDLLADMILNSTFDKSELERERGVVLQEIGRYEDLPESVAWDHFRSTAYPDQPLGRTILGEKEIIQNLTQAQLIKFVEEKYLPNKMILAAAGNINHDQIVKKAEQLFSTLPSRKDLKYTPAVYHGGEWKQSKELEQAHFYFGFNGVSFHDPDYYTAKVLASLLGGGISSRLFQEIREKRGLVYDIYASSLCEEDSGLFHIGGGTGGHQINELFDILILEIKKICTERISLKEIERAKTQIKANLLMSLESVYSVAERLVFSLQIFNRYFSAEEFIENIESVQEKQLQNLSIRFLSSPLLLSIFGPIIEKKTYEEISHRLIS